MTMVIRTIIRTLIILLVAGLVVGGIALFAQTSLAQSLASHQEGHGPPPVGMGLGTGTGEDGTISHEGREFFPGGEWSGEGSGRRFGDRHPPHERTGEIGEIGATGETGERGGLTGTEDGADAFPGTFAGEPQMRTRGDEGFSLARALPGLAKNLGIIALVILIVFAIRKGFGLLTGRRKAQPAPGVG
ncbi:MAG: hypothetical protein HC884_01445 [Chloroflexaceae bacterium]|nr:hypothetical protein [Chloroflexaceae bacterium]